MRDDDQRGPGGPPPALDDEVEILEVVGVDEDGSTLPAEAEPEPDARADDAHELTLAFDEDPDESVPRDRAPARGERNEHYLRLLADYENLRKRMERERQDYEENANSALVGRLLPVLDNFERALGSEADGGEDKTFRDGVTLIYRHLLQELRKEGLAPIDAVGQMFDPHVHDAVATQREAGLSDNLVVEELQRGYLFRNRLLRPALVKVNVRGAHGPVGSGRKGS